MIWPPEAYAVESDLLITEDPAAKSLTVFSPTRKPSFPLGFSIFIIITVFVAFFLNTGYNVSNMNFANILPYLQIILSVLLIGGVLLQQSEASLGSAFGGGDSFSSAHHSKRGAEKMVFTATIIFAVLFTLTSLALLFVTK